MSEFLLNAALGAAERALIPDSLLRWGVRRLCRQRLDEEKMPSEPTQQRSPIA